MSASRVLLTPLITQSICSYLNYKEAIQLWEAYQSVIPDFELKSEIPIEDFDKLVNSLPKVNSDYIRLYLIIQEHGSKYGFIKIIKRDDLNNFRFLVARGVGSIELAWQQLKELKYQPIRIFDYLISLMEDINEIGSDNRTLLMNVVKYGTPEIVNYCLNLGANPHLKNSNQETALTMALQRKDFTILEILLKAGADPNSSDINGNNSIGYLIHNSYPFLTSPNVNSESRLLQSVYSLMFPQLGNHKYREEMEIANKELIQLLLRFGADINHQNFDGNTVLMETVRIAYHDYLEFLLELGADPNLANNSGKTALIRTITEDSPRYAQILLQARANPNQTTNEGDTALIIAIRKNRTEIIKLLLEFGADPNIENNQGETAIQCALASSSYHKKKIVRELIRHGADTQLKDLNFRNKLSYLRHKL